MPINFEPSNFLTLVIACKLMVSTWIHESWLLYCGKDLTIRADSSLNVSHETGFGF